MDRKFIDISQLGCPQYADIRFPKIRCTFACYEFNHAYAL